MVSSSLLSNNDSTVFIGNALGFLMSFSLGGMSLIIDLDSNCPEILKHIANHVYAELLKSVMNYKKKIIISEEVIHGQRGVGGALPNIRSPP